MKQFEVGKEYRLPKECCSHITITKHTKCYVWCENVNGLTFQKKIRYDIDGNEYIILTRKDYIYLYNDNNIVGSWHLITK